MHGDFAALAPQTKASMQRAVGRPWTPEEDSLLTQAVAIYGENDNWKTVALSIPGRTNKACRKRWLHSLSPSVKKSAWTQEEDQLLLSLYAVHSTKWAIIARHIPGRTDDACSKRYREALDPSLNRGEWTTEDDTTLLGAYARLGGKWGQVGQELNRSGLGWRMLERRRIAGARGASSNPPPLGSTSANVPIWTQTSSPQHEELCLDPREFLADLSPSLPDPVEGYSTQDGLTAISTVRRDSCQVEQHIHVASPFDPHSSHHSQYPPYYTGLHDSDSVDTHILPPIPDGQDFIPHGDCGNVSDESTDTIRGDTVERCDAGPTEVPYEDLSKHFLPDHTLASRTSSAMTLTPEISVPIQTPAPVSTVPESASHHRYYRTPAEKAKSATVPQPILAYACGHPDCWPVNTEASKSCFATSKHLSDHNKSSHAADLGGSTPFRCGLAGCKKSWKLQSINGLQYHLQVSKTHFQQALSNASATSIAPEDSTNAPLNSAGGSRPKSKKIYPCPHQQCRHEYKQLSGLRYHLAHGHPAELPVQLEVIPPTLARKLAQKAEYQGDPKV
ncbi:uncharacterized protein FIBRA_02357 [Fibroporia radiculosa]|uniref:Uncharacterized protein n=1 Tax=Fibroporia radiculosa TaxID=599839 RepID=J4HUS8_9APHY|nr:uncharacterized protein FIBRA_02357 [Fibroporia radiculosa]CCM00327.1 predicted protein [Fibroporia radiculosa]